MPAIIKNNSDRIIPRFVAITPLELYLQQVKGTYDAIRVLNSGEDMTYIPPQMGGIMGQREVQDQQIVLELTDFEVK